MSIGLKVVGVSISLASCVWAHADSYYVAPTSVVGASEKQAITVTELIKNDVSSLPSQTLSSAPESAQYVLHPKLIKLGSAYILSVQKMTKGQVRFATQLKAARFDEMDGVCARVVRSVVSEKSADVDARVDDVTQQEAEAHINRRQTVNRWYFGFGPAGAVHLDTSGGLINIAIGYFWELESQNAIKLVYEGTSDRMWTFGLGVNHYFSDQEITPLLTAEIAYGAAKREDANGNELETTNGFVA